MMTCSTFIFTASVTGRNTFMRRLYQVVVGRILCGFTSSEEWVTGTNHQGWLIHFTAEKCLRYGFLSEDDFRDINTVAIVRNPFSRMVSIYSYNQVGLCCESFETFMKRWCKKYEVYKVTGRTDEWDVYCHVLPQFEYTHNMSDQIIKCIVRQEDVNQVGIDEKNFLTNIPKCIRDALGNMPKINRRKRPQPWWEYYTQETMDMVIDMYGRDFVQFGYDTNIKERPDLKPKAIPDSVHDEVIPIVKDEASLQFKSFKTITGFYKGDGDDDVLPKGAGRDEDEYEPQETDSLLLDTSIL
mmetsp:Transcript_33840/g.41711  ORF Transcript_33840/g.41711 Transcript_33840/m.41711 type:complete len:298 (+) Transcript_33840:418-1311(+)